MPLFLKLVAALFLAAGWSVVVARSRCVRGTTLRPAFLWLCGGLLLWSATWTAEAFDRLNAGTADLLWYGVAVVLLCPPVAVLGARDPGARAWTWFVVIPLLVVLGLPAFSQWSAIMRGDRLHLEWPMLLGYLMVLVMGTGNYFGTRRTAAALFYALGLVLLVLPMAAEATGLPVTEEAARFWATMTFPCALILGICRLREPPAPGYDRLWLDFRDTFGIVWAKRVAERVNEAGHAQEWPLRLELHGIVWQGNAIDDAERQRSLAGLDHTFRWLLKRFVTPEWIVARLKANRDWTDETRQLS